MPERYPLTPPPATSAMASAVMRGNRRRDTKPELSLRAALHKKGLRYRVDYSLQARSRRVRPDVVFTRQRIAVFLDGCFWHRCPEHGVPPRANSDYWRPKLDRNVERDRAVDAALELNGWAVIRVWEHEDPERAAERIASAVRSPKR